jgi:hypothetical protein
MGPDLVQSHSSWFRSKIIEDRLASQTNRWAERPYTYNAGGLIFIIDTDNPWEGHTYRQDLSNSDRDFGTHAKRVNRRVLLILLNKFDRWGSATESREAMMHR